MEQDKNKAGYKRPQITVLKKKIEDLTNNINRLQRALDSEQERTSQQEHTIKSQAAFIKELQKKYEAASMLHRAAAAENARLHNRTFWQRLFNIMPKEEA